MAEVMSLESVLAARKLLKTSLENSRALSSALHETKPKLAQISKSLPLLEATIKPIASIRDQINLAVVPAAAALNILDSIRELQKSLFSNHSELFSYLAALKRLEQALKFLADNCNLASKWLESVVELLEEDRDVNEVYVSNLKRSLRILHELPAEAVLCAALDKLERLFERLVSDADDPLALNSNIPQEYLQKLQFAVERLNANNRISNCMNVLIAVRSEIARRRLEALDLEYLEKTNSDGCVSDWGKDLEFSVKNVLEFEHRLCLQIFMNVRSDVGTVCFAKIVSNSGFLSFLRFGMNVAKSKKEASKLLKLLEIFSVLNKLRVDFNRLFGHESCGEIRNKTRYLIKEVVNNAVEIFFELPAQVRVQRYSSPPADGSVPKLVSFATDYCNQLLNEHFRPNMSQILEIKRSWRTKKHQAEEEEQEVTINKIVYSIMKEIALNLDSWSKSYENRTLSYIYMMNNHSHFFSLKATSLGALMGETWVSSHGRYRDYYLALYLRESWGKLPAMLNQQSPSLGRLKAFKEAFDEMYKTQVNWVVSDEELRQKIYELVLQMLVSAYEGSLQRYGHFIKQEEDYSVQSMKTKLSALFQNKDGSKKGGKESHFTEKVRSAFVSQLRLTLEAM